MALNPHQRKKVDISAMTEEEQKLFRLYGKLPPKKNVAKHNLMERKYFDSGDYALSKAGKTAPQSVGTAIPSPENIHHATHPCNLSSPNPSNSTPIISSNTASTVMSSELDALGNPILVTNGEIDPAQSAPECAPDQSSAEPVADNQAAPGPTTARQVEPVQVSEN